MSGAELFQQRQEAFQKSCLTYWRYVFNDHAMLFFVFLLGGVAYSTSKDPQLLLTLRAAVGIIGIALAFIFALAPSYPLYLEEADSYWLRADRQFWESYGAKAQQSAARMAGLRLLMTWALIGLTHFLPPIDLVIFALITGGGLILQLQVRKRKGVGLIQNDFGATFRKDRRRQEAWWRFFSQFTRVKELQMTQVKRRAYLDPLMRWAGKRMTTVLGTRQLALALRSTSYLTSWAWLTLLGLGLSFSQLTGGLLLAGQAIFLTMTALQWGSLRQVEAPDFFMRVERPSEAAKEHDFRQILRGAILLEALIFGIVSKVTHGEATPYWEVAVFLAFACCLYGLSAYRKRRVRD